MLIYIIVNKNHCILSLILILKYVEAYGVKLLIIIPFPKLKNNIEKLIINKILY